MTETMTADELARLCDIETIMRSAHEGGIAEGERRATAAIVAWINADATMCDCSAHNENECACGAWDDYKRVYETDIADAIERGDHLEDTRAMVSATPALEPHTSPPTR